MTFNDIFKSSFLENISSVGILDIMIALILAFGIGLFIYLIYKKTFSGVMYSSSFGVTLIALTMITTVVILAVTSNVVLSLGMVGALSIVRFRTAIKDSRDTAYIFWAIIVGICCGVGDFVVATIGSATIFIIMLLFGKIRNDNRVLLIIRGKRTLENKIQSSVLEHFGKKANIRVKNTTTSSIELIYETTKKQFEKEQSIEQSISKKLYKLRGIEYVNMVVQNDEISG